MTCKLNRNCLLSVVVPIAIMIVMTALAVRAQVGGWAYTAPATSTLTHVNRSQIAATHEKSAGARPMAGTAPVFLPRVPYDLGVPSGFSVAAADLNADGHTDIVTPSSLLFGNGHGWFEPPLSYDSGPPGTESPLSVTVGDVNGDGRPDVLVGNMCSDPSCLYSSVGVLLGNGDGTLQPAVALSTGGQYAYSLTTADVNADGKPDIVVANQCVKWFCASGTVVAVLIGNGDGTFQPPVTYSGGEGNGGVANSLAVADVNGDGKLDVVVATGQSNGHGAVGVLLGNGDGTFQAAAEYESGVCADSYSPALGVGDVNADGKPDITAVNWCANPSNGLLGVLLGNGDGTFQAAVTYDTGAAAPFSVVIADVNRDGKPDLVTPNDYCNDCSGGKLLGILLGNGDGTFQPVVLYRAQPGLTAAAVADVNGDGEPDIIATAGAANVLLTKTGVPTNTVVITSGSPTIVGQPVTFTATVTASKGSIPEGELMAFYDGITALGLVKLAGGTAAFTTSSLSAKTHSIKATYVGDATFRLGSGHVQQKVLKYLTTTALTSDPNPSNYGQSVTFTATVTPTGPYPLTGKVRFWDGTLGIGSATLSGGVATLTKSKLAVGTHPITAQYLGDAASAKSTSSVLDQVVK